MQKEGLPIFNGKDFPVWKMVIEQYLAVKRFKKYLTAEPDIKVPEEVTQDQEALSILTRSLDFKHARIVLCCKNAKTAWSKLCQVHERKSEASKLGLQRQFFTIKMEHNEEVAEYVSRVEYLKSQLEDVGCPVSESSVVAKIISGLPPAYKSFCTQWGSATADQQKISTLLDRLLEEEALQGAHRRGPKEGVAFSADSPARKGDKPRGSGRGTSSSSSGRGNGRRRGRGRDKTKSNKCFKCGKEGHWANKCPEKGDQPQPSSSKDEKSKATKPAATVIAESLLSESTKEQWIVDSGATEHMSYES